MIKILGWIIDIAFAVCVVLVGWEILSNGNGLLVAIRWAVGLAAVGVVLTIMTAGRSS